MMQRRTLAAWVAASSALWLAAPVWAAAETPDALVKRLSADILETIKADPELRNGNIARISQVVDSTVMPHVNFRRMTSAAVGPQWRQATPAQRERLQQEFKLMLIRTYAGALKQVSDQRVVVKPLRAAPDDKDVLVRTEVHGKGEPVQLDFRLENSDGKGWKIYNLNVLGVWMVETYRTQFAQELNKGGIDGLINALSNRTMAADAKTTK
ncbi:ABC transporter substrate-binding protein [Comamonas sp.]|uniref:MlaC/ttg2D family ABC transporter substrate-binding protein n=1 Tax=Comamonas sp. TaxID=34028 RepID=UPI002899100A|nr:ABC transporter substrate-binding protein [Comamonas sp.]